MAGYIVAGAAARVRVVVDGVIAPPALTADRLAPGGTDFVFVGHGSSEPGVSVVPARLGLVRDIDLELGLGEGAGACLGPARPPSGAKILSEVATFDFAGVTSDPD